MFPILTSAGASTAATQAQPPRAGGQAPGGFAALLSPTQQFVPAVQAPQSPAAASGKVTVPGDPAAGRAALAGLAADITKLAAATGEALESADVAEQGTILANAAETLVSLVEGFDAATGADAMEVFTSALADPGGLVFPEFEAGAIAPQQVEELFAMVAGALGLVLQQPAADAAPVRTASLTATPGAGTAAGPVVAEASAGPAKGGKVEQMPKPTTETPGRSVSLVDAGTDPRPGRTPDAVSKDIARPVETSAITANTAISNVTETQTGPAPDFKAMLGAALQADRADAPAAQVSEFRSVEAVQSKAAPVVQTPSSAPTLPPPSGFSRSLANQIRGSSFVDGRTTVSLMPKGLGEIEIDLRPDEAGQLRIVVRAENATVLQALRGDRDGLIAAMADGGVAVDDGQLSFEDFGQREPRDDAPGFGGGAGPVREDEDAAPTELVADHQPMLGDGRIDIVT